MNADIDNIQKPAGDRPAGFCPFCDYQVMGPGVCPECGQTLSSDDIVIRSPSRARQYLRKYSIRIAPFLFIFGISFAVYQSDIWHRAVPTYWLIENGLSESWSKLELARRLRAGTLSKKQLTAFYSKYAAVDLEIWFDPTGCQFAVRISQNRPPLGRLSAVPHISTKKFAIDGKFRLIQGRCFLAFAPIRPQDADASLHYVSSDLTWDEVADRDELTISCAGTVIFQTTDPIHSRELARIGNAFPFSVSQTVKVPPRSQAGPTRAIDLTDF